MLKRGFGLISVRACRPSFHGIFRSRINTFTMASLTGTLRQVTNPGQTGRKGFKLRLATIIRLQQVQHLRTWLRSRCQASGKGTREGVSEQAPSAEQNRSAEGAASGPPEINPGKSSERYLEARFENVVRAVRS
jgi:hypothetical protein